MKRHPEGTTQMTRQRAVQRISPGVKALLQHRFHDLLLTYVAKHPRMFGFQRVYIRESHFYDLIAINEEGSPVRVEIEKAARDARRFRQDNPTECDMIIAYYPTAKPLNVPVQLVDRRHFLSYVEGLI